MLGASWVRYVRVNASKKRSAGLVVLSQPCRAEPFGILGISSMIPAS